MVVIKLEKNEYPSADPQKKCFLTQIKIPDFTEIHKNGYVQNRLRRDKYRRTQLYVLLPTKDINPAETTSNLGYFHQPEPQTETTPGLIN